MGRSIKKGSTDQSTVIRIIDATTGLPETAVTFETVGIALWWRREKEAVTAITEATLAAVDSAHSDGGIIHMSDGYYRLDLPDAAVAAGAGENEVFIGGTVTGMVVIGNSHALVDYDPYDTVRMGMTALPNAVADAAGGLPISDAGGLDLDATKADTTEILTRLPDATAGAANGLPIIDATGVKLTKTVDLTAGQAIACSDKTGFSLSATGADLGDTGVS